MYDTSAPLLVFGIPGTIMAFLVLSFAKHPVLDLSEFFLAGILMVILEILIAGILYHSADRIWKRTHKI